MAGLTVMKKFSKEKLHLPKIDGITLRWLINIIGVIVVFFIIVFIISAFQLKIHIIPMSKVYSIPVLLQLLSVISAQILMRVILLNSQPQNTLTAIVIRKKLLLG